MPPGRSGTKRSPGPGEASTNSGVGSTQGAQGHLDAVCEKLEGRLRAGVERVLHCARVAEDKEVLAANSLSLLQHELSGAPHLPQPSPLDASMRVIATRAKSRPGTSTPEIYQDSQRASQRDEYPQTHLLHTPRVHQELDNSQQYLILQVTGTVAEHLASGSNGADLRMRLDVCVLSAAAMTWEAAHVSVKSGGQVTLLARTPWQCVLHGTAIGDGGLEVDVDIVLQDGRRQALGVTTLLSPASLLQNHVLQRKAPSPAAVAAVPEDGACTWPPEEDVLLATGGVAKRGIFESLTCDVETKVRQAAGVTRAEVRAPSVLALASYANAVRQSVPDGVKVRFEATTKQNLESLDKWYNALNRELSEFRKAAAQSCGSGFDVDVIRRLIQLQINLDEARGCCLERLQKP